MTGRARPSSSTPSAASAQDGSSRYSLGFKRGAPRIARSDNGLELFPLSVRRRGGIAAAFSALGRACKNWLHERIRGELRRECRSTQRASETEVKPSPSPRFRARERTTAMRARIRPSTSSGQRTSVWAQPVPKAERGLLRQSQIIHGPMK